MQKKEKRGTEETKWVSEEIFRERMVLTIIMLTHVQIQFQ